LSSEKIEEARSLARAGKHKEAQQILRKLTEQDPQNEEAWLAYVNTMSDSDMARIEALRQYLTINPDSLSARDELRQLEKENRGGRPRYVPPPQAPSSDEPTLDERGEADIEDIWIEELPGYFREGPTSVSSRYPPGMISKWISRTLFLVVILAVAALAILPIWEGRNLFSYLSGMIPRIIEVNQDRSDQAGEGPTPGTDSILNADLASICPQGMDFGEGFVLADELRGLADVQVIQSQGEGLRDYYKNRWDSPEAPYFYCELLVYGSTADANKAFENVRLRMSTAGSPIAIGGYGDERIGHQIDAAKIFYEFAYRRGQVIVKLTSFDQEGEKALSVMREIVKQVDDRLKAYTVR
jgi:hypothetical protein